MYFKEHATLGVSNPVIEDSSIEITEALLADIKIKEVRAIYPLVKAINSGRLTRNMTFYPAESLIGKNKGDDPTGYASFVKPYGKPVIREHQSQNVPGLLGNSENADVPMGRIIYGGFKKRVEKVDGPGTLPSKKYVPGTVEGDGSMFMVPAITEPEAITRVLGGAYQTVSIGSRVDNVWESISGKNIAEIRRKGEELPPYERGQLYEGKLSYWKMGDVKGVELSFVNVPSDEYAGVVDPDIGAEGIRLLVAEKKSGKSNEFNFFDAKTQDKVELNLDEYVVDESFFVDSAKVGQHIWWLSETANVTESQEIETSEEPMTKELNELLTQINLEEVSIDAELITKMVNGDALSEYTISDIDLFREVQDFIATSNEWNETAVKNTIALYEKKGGSISLTPAPIDENTKVTLGELYNIEGDLATLEANLTHKEWKELPDECFAGENRTIPITNFESAVFASKLVEKASIASTMLIEYGILLSETFSLSPIYIKSEKNVHVLNIKSLEEVSPLLENVDTICESYSLNEDQKSQLVSFLENCTEDTFKNIETSPLFSYTEQSVKPIVLGTEFLVQYFVNNEVSTTRDNLVTLVGMVRKHNHTKEELDEAYKAYNVFGTSVLRKFLEATPAKVEETSTEEENLTDTSTSVVETISDPFEVPETPTIEKKKESKNVWLGYRVKPTKRGNNNPINIKEKR